VENGEATSGSGHGDVEGSQPSRRHVAATACLLETRYARAWTGDNDGVELESVGPFGRDNHQVSGHSLRTDRAGIDRVDPPARRSRRCRQPERPSR
jgi:hypothetical protein